MSLRAAIDALQPEMTAWRHDLHAHPEMGFEEHRTSARVAALLEGWGIEVHRGLGGTGVVGVVRGRPGNRAIGLRADMDALPMQEETGLPYASTAPGVMHACGHDGHITMLLGAAKYLAQTRNFSGTVHLIFQPAEEGLAGAKAMLDDGLFERFPCDAVYGLHNEPGLPLGQVAVRAGTVLAAVDYFSVTVVGRASHGAQPHKGIDTISVTAAIIGALQQVVARQVDPLQTAVISVGRIQGGTSDIIIPERVSFSGSVRTLVPEVRDQVEAAFRRAAEGTAMAMGARVEIEYRRAYPPTINTPAEAERAALAAGALLGEGALRRTDPPITAGEDFAFLLERCPGAYVLFGQAQEGRFAISPHNSHYEFNDALLPLGAAYLAQLAEQELS
ncbi:M20 aminoacylase family protein [Pseudoroseomonas cervicalis]|uniref:M20 aminoacylase family protein n=1 Tax=Teichococcus cervicalis TaxID=204525 RepID=UPI0022F170E0|nr:M20 aminoacylase family protein [Pseudoroseomonas cervicalis]WBV44355.1 M20 family metallopeptidase [Pseudoroseomonas cervicalis]